MNTLPSACRINPTIPILACRGASITTDYAGVKTWCSPRLLLFDARHPLTAPSRHRALVPAGTRILSAMALPTPPMQPVLTLVVVWLRASGLGFDLLGIQAVVGPITTYREILTFNPAPPGTVYLLCRQSAFQHFRGTEAEMLAWLDTQTGQRLTLGELAVDRHDPGITTARLMLQSFARWLLSRARRGGRFLPPVGGTFRPDGSLTAARRR